MGKETKIAWCDATVNFWTGCTKCAPECAHCYAERWAKRTGRDFSRVTRTADATFYAPLKWKEPKRIFVESLGDFFHEDVDPAWRAEAWRVIWTACQHTYIIPTKRPGNIPAMLPGPLGWPDLFRHVWFLVSAGTNESLARFWPVLRDIPGLSVRGISMEPLLENLELDRWWSPEPDRLPDWIIVAGESGPSRRAMPAGAALDVCNWCERYQVRFFFKGHIGNVHTPANELLDGKVYHEFP